MCCSFVKYLLFDSSNKISIIDYSYTIILSLFTAVCNIF